jgi:eukaryotic-like serine/threonine-protein kinase
LRGVRDELTLRAEARLGTFLQNKYRLDRVLGVGGMAAVFAGQHRNGNPVAVKVLHADLSIDPGVRRRFLREGYIANKVDHRGAVRVLDDDTSEDGSVFLVMELLEGQTLDERLVAAGGRLPSAEVCPIVIQILDVLVAAHTRGIVHRDIKPGNVFVTTGSTVKVLDFGIARLREAGAKHTGSGLAIGTPAFMPPEQSRGRKDEVDAQSDVWAVGATMFELLSGEYVHGNAGTVEELFIASATRKARTLRGVAGVPDVVAEVVDRALAFDKRNRWPSALTMQKALERAHAIAHEGSSAARRAAVTAPATPVASLRTTPASDEARARPSTVGGLSRYVGVDGGKGRLAGAARVLGALVAVCALALVVVKVRAREGTSPPTTATSVPAIAPAVASQAAAPPPAPSDVPDDTPTVDVASLPQVKPTLVLRAPSAPTASPHGGGVASHAAQAACHLEPYAEMVKGEPVTRYRQICP